MPNSSSLQPAHARRALIEDIKEDKLGWLRHGVAALAVSLLGLGVAGSVVLTGAAQHTSTGTRTPPPRSPPAGPRTRPAVTAPAHPSIRRRCKSLADQRAEELSKAEDDVAEAATGKGAKAREKALESASDATRKQAALIANGKAGSTTAGSSGTPSPTPAADASKVKSGGKSCMPITRGYSIAARFGQVGIVVALSHRFRLLRTRRHPAACSCGRCGDQRRIRLGQRLGRQLRGHQVPGRHPDPDGAHVDRLGAGRSDRQSPVSSSARSA